MENLNRLIISKETKTVIKKFPKKQKSRISNYSKKLKRRKHFLTYFYMVNVTNKTRQRQYKRRKLQPLSLGNTDAKILNKVLINPIQ